MFRIATKNATEGFLWDYGQRCFYQKNGYR